MMQLFRHYVERRSLRELLLKSLLFTATVAFIAYFLPRDGEFSYHFELNKPWQYGQLMATFDFPIYKDEAVVKHERDSLVSAFQPYYDLDISIQKEAIDRFRADYNRLY
ncbi:MAG: hydrolase, partial [Prevotellaceae bacterium]|nr:hydrolase [Prevotellaceae bacterium]